MFPLRQIDSESITIDATAGGVGLTAAKITTRVFQALITIEDAQARYNCYTAPTAAGTEGSPTLDPGDQLIIIGEPDLKSFRAIRTTSTSAVARVSYFGSG